ncbi:MAG: hypothetical protein F4229_03855 [Gammaproteobacteria bacterium]|nr:hypothetical protein [Gammaproteobacteria bacterium]MYF92047.1 hypothetical protein [Gemmatimonadota bacterium]
MLKWIFLALALWFFYLNHSSVSQDHRDDLVYAERAGREQGYHAGYQDGYVSGYVDAEEGNPRLH